MQDLKPRVRVKAGAVAFPAAPAASKAPTITARYLRDTRTGMLSMRRAVTRDAKWDVAEAAQRASSLAYDFIRNSGYLAGAVNQVLCDTIGEELKLNCRAQLQALGYSAEDEGKWQRDVERRWRRWSYDAKECDLAGKMTIAEMTDAMLRSYLATGEGFAILDSLTVRQRRMLKCSTGLKVTLVPAHRCPNVSREFEGFNGGIFHDAWDRARFYRFRRRESGIDVDHDVPASDVIHVMDRGDNLGSPRGISPMAPILRAAAQGDQLADATLAVALMQSAFAAVVRSPEPSETAFQALQTLEGLEAPMGEDPLGWGEYLGGLRADLLEVWAQRIDALKNGSLALNDPARVAHLGPGETLEMVTADNRADNYKALWETLAREMARCLGLTFESFAGDHSNATYSSVRMAWASIWPVVMRRRERIAVPFVQSVYERWLEDEIAEGRIDFRGGYQAFAANREAVFQAEFQGPSQPTADDYKSAMAAKVKLETGQASLEEIHAAAGQNHSETLAAIERGHQWFTERGIPSPYGRSTGGGAGPLGSAADGNREPANASV
ncbi:phage portal protein, lambda family [Fulvimarina manganoxydans]|uniref:Phage portal protein, lambda family n=1 Tax=Fulvimarina manganoxydans TaxID=937218 RepID=A0A1W1Z372_9HYPH|nr:phage portal protein [Fulvimarina manganoxydans]SMC42900.1 phage portal protein, lambda family [Fulvimarina manganoxydans]